MIDSRLNRLLMLDIHRDALNETDTKLTTEKFIKVKEYRIFTFGLYQF